MRLNDLKKELKQEISEIKQRINEIIEYDVTATDDQKEQQILGYFNLAGAELKNYYENLLSEKERVLKKISLEGII